MTISTGSTYTLGSVVQEVVDKNLRMFPVLFKQFAHLAYAFFDVKQLAGQGGLTIKPKEIPGIESTITVDGFSVKWLDYSLFDFSTAVSTTDAALTVTAGAITLDVTATSGLSVNDTVYFVKSAAGAQLDGIVTAVVDANTVTVKLQTVNGSTTIPATVAVEAGQVIERGFWTRNDNDEIVRPSALYDYKEFHSYVQHFSRRIEFTKAELNKEYRYEQDAKLEAQKRFEYNIAILFQEVNKALYKGKNRGPGAGANDKMEMLGLETICRELGSVADLSASTDPIGDLFGEIEKSFRSGSIVGSEPIMLLVNDKFLTELANSNADKVRYDKTVDSLKFSVPTLTTIYGEVDIIRDPMLNRLYSTSVAFLVPRSLVKLWVRENQDFEPKRGISRADQSVRLYPVIHNLREKALYDIEFELGLIAGGLSADPAPFRMVTGFKKGTVGVYA